MVRAIAKMYHMTIERGFYSPSNGTIANVVLCDIDLHIQGQTLSCYCYAFTIKNCAGSGFLRQIFLDFHSPPPLS